jgi:hypothetical protein
MKKATFILFLIASSFSFGQKSEIENLINQIVVNEIPNSFNFYYLVTKSLKEPEIYDSIGKYRRRELKMMDKEFPLDLIYKKNKKEGNWANYNLKKVRYVSEEYGNRTSPPRRKNIRFVKYNINQKEYDSLIENRKPHTIIVKKKWLWSKKNIWDNKKFHNEVIIAWEIDEEKHKEEKMYVEFSTPMFSKDKKYARISVFKNKRCNGNGFTALYQNIDGIWTHIMEYNELSSSVWVSHSRCEDISVSY